MPEDDPRLSGAAPFPTPVGIEVEHSACTAAIAWAERSEELGVTPDWIEAD